MNVRLTLGALLPVALVACREPPAFRARWSVIDRDGDVRATTESQECSTLGINTVRVRVFDEDGLVVEAFHPCFAGGFADEDVTVRGPALSPGPYAVEVRGVQRNLEPWPVAIAATDGELTECSLDDVACDPRDIACDCATFEARDGRVARLVDFELAAPDECVDGIDNDNDGLLDTNDPSCAQGNVPGHEGDPVSRVQFRILLSLLGGNDGASCLALGLSDLRARLCLRDPGADLGPCDDEALQNVLACRDGEPVYFEETLPQGEYTLEIVARGPQGEVRTLPSRFALTVAEGAGAFVPIDLAFGAQSFEPPIEASAGFVLAFEDPATEGSRGCAPSPGQEGATIADVGLEILDAHGGALGTAVTLADGTALDGAPLACPSSVLRTEVLMWGGYSLRVVTRAADGTVCHTTDGAGVEGADAPLRLAPTTLSLVVPAVVDGDGEPPPACR